MKSRITQLFRTFLLAELVKGLLLTGRHLFQHKICKLDRALEAPYR